MYPHTARPRLRDFDYTGARTYHVTLVTASRAPLLTGDHASFVVAHLRQAAAASRFELLAYVVMPDHMHILAAAREETSNLVRFVQRLKQATSFRFTRERKKRLWQPSFYDHILRSDEDALSVAGYIWDNPCRAELIAAGERWPYCGGTLFDEHRSDE